VFAGLRVILYDYNWIGVCELGVRDSQALGDERKYLQATAGIYSYLKAITTCGGDGDHLQSFEGDNKYLKAPAGIC
jgi:hypothetical protein